MPRRKKSRVKGGSARHGEKVKREPAARLQGADGGLDGQLQVVWRAVQPRQQKGCKQVACACQPRISFTMMFLSQVHMRICMHLVRIRATDTDGSLAEWATHPAYVAELI